MLKAYRTCMISMLGCLFGFLVVHVISFSMALNNKTTHALPAAMRSGMQCSTTSWWEYLLQHCVDGVLLPICDYAARRNKKWKRKQTDMPSGSSTIAAGTAGNAFSIGLPMPTLACALPTSEPPRERLVRTL